MAPPYMQLMWGSYQSANKPLIVWDVISGQERRILENPSVEDVSIASTSQGMILAFTSLIRAEFGLGMKLSIYKVPASMYAIQYMRDEIFRLSSCISAIGEVVLSPDGSSMAVPLGGCGNDLAILDVNSGKSGKFIPGMHSYGMAFTPNGRLLALDPEYGYMTNHITHLILRDWTDWHWGDPDPIKSLPYENTEFLVFSTDATLLAGATSDGRIILWDLVSGDRLHTLAGHHAKINSLAFSSDGSFLASGGLDKNIILWDVVSGEPLFRRSTSEEISVVAFSPDGSILASASYEEVILWDTETMEPICSLKGHNGYVNSRYFSSDGNTLISSSCDGTVVFWDIGGIQTATL